jgi:hypothetical protein
MRPRLSPMLYQDPWAGHYSQVLQQPSSPGAFHKRSISQPGLSQKLEGKPLQNKPSREQDHTEDNSD